MSTERITGLLFLTIIFSFFSNHNISAQLQLNSSFTLDTAKNQVFPYDLEFSLSLVGKKSAPIKQAFLFRLDDKGKVIFDRNTSLVQLGWLPNAQSQILDKINRDSISSQTRILTTKDSVVRWNNELTEKNKQLSKLKLKNKRSEMESDKIEQLACELSVLGSKISERKADEKFQKDIAKRKKFVRKIKKQPELSPPLEILKRSGDTVTVRVPPLRPNKKYIVVVTNESKKVAVLESLVKNYYSCAVLDGVELSLIPQRYLPKGDFKFEVPAQQLKGSFDKAKEKLSPLLEMDAFDLNYDIIPSNLSHPDPFLASYVFNDSSSKAVPIVEGYLKINGLLATLKTDGDSLVRGRYKIDFDSVGRINVNTASPANLKSRLIAIDQHLQHISLAKQYLYFLTQTVDADFNNYADYFDIISQITTKNKEKIEDKFKIRSSIEKQLNDMTVPVGLQTGTVENNTYNYQFLARNSRLIKSDFGLLYYFSNDSGFSGFAPYIGVHFDIRPTNEDVPFYQIKGWEKFLTFQLAVPMFTEDLVEGERRKHLVGGHFSLYGGVGVNLSHVIRVSYGAILFKSIDGTFNGQGKYKISSTHAFSIGINLKVRTLFEGIYDSIQSLKGK